MLKTQGEAMDNPGATALDDTRFRQVLSHYPTGVVIITALGEDGQHLGMVVGSFTSVSLRPPLVAFLADHNSRTYGQLKKARNFVINMLASDQEQLCRQFSSRTVDDKWAGVGWKTTARGVRKIDGVVAHIECSHSATHVAGDHDIVICRVDDLEVTNPVLPLLFFQGAYGKFVPQTLVMPSQIEVAAPLRIVDVARPYMEELTRELDAECMAQAKVGGQLVFLASFGIRDELSAAPHVGHRIPHVPPLGMLYAAWESEAVVDDWLNGAVAKAAPGIEDELRSALERVRTRGFTIALEAEAYGPLERVRERFTNGLASPADEKFLRTMALDLTRHYEPADLPISADTRVRVIGVPVFTTAKNVGLVLQVWNPVPTSKLPLTTIIERLQDVAQSISRDLRLRFQS